jgi:hypothetical protein
MQETFNPDLFVAKWYCGSVYIENLPQFAADALEAGYDGPALRRLAGLMKPTLTDVGDLFQRSLAEIGTITIQNLEQATILLARTTARDIIEQKIDPIHGMNAIAGLAWAVDYLAYLMPLYGLAEMPQWVNMRHPAHN